MILVLHLLSCGCKVIDEQELFNLASLLNGLSVTNGPVRAVCDLDTVVVHSTSNANNTNLGPVIGLLLEFLVQ